MPMRHSILIFSLALLATSAPAQTPGPVLDDYEMARDAVSRGDFLPLDRILDIVGKTHPGRLVELELELDDDRWVYEVEIVTKDGRLVEIDLDAATGTIIGVEEDDD